MKKFTPVLAISFVVLMVAGLVFYFSTKRHTQGEVPGTGAITSIPAFDVPLSTSIPVLTDTADGLLAYRNSAFHFSLRIPPGYPATEYKEAGGALTVTFQDPHTNRGFEVYVTPYTGTQITNERFRNDQPSGVYLQPTDVMIDGTRATMFFGKNSIMGDTREVWFIKNGFLYEVTTYKELDAWLADIMQTWKFI